MAKPKSIEFKAEKKPVKSKPKSKPKPAKPTPKSKPKPVKAEPVKAKPVKAKPVEAKPVEAKPVKKTKAKKQFKVPDEESIKDRNLSVHGLKEADLIRTQKKGGSESDFQNVSKSGKGRETAGNERWQVTISGIEQRPYFRTARKAAVVAALMRKSLH